MFKAGQTGIGLVLSAWALTFPLSASAQVAPAPPTSPGPSMPSASMMANPYLNPYMNPYLNPLAGGQPMNANNALLYMYMANAARGGVGSGRLSNPAPTARRSKAAEMPNSSAVPGGGAARFFNPGGAKTGTASRYYNQHGRYFQNNGR